MDINRTTLAKDKKHKKYKNKMKIIKTASAYNNNSKWC